MSRYVPEFALVTGLLLSLTLFVAGVLFTGDLLRTLLVAVAVCYPFVGFAVLRSDDPTTVLPPTAVAVAGALVGLLVWGVALWAEPSLGTVTFGLFFALLAALPAAAYGVHFGSPWNGSPRALGVGAVLVALGSLALGLLTDTTLFGVADALLVGVGAGLYLDRCGYRPSRRTRRRLVAGGALVGLAAVGVGVAVGGGSGLGDWTVVGVAAALGPGVYVALTDRRGG